ncbi:MAG: methylated-DNA--[protein]-cysteine S-methyltransferase [Ferruginibacter sp.]|nr:methylated-DNA--[protein]-cysteine S-methyltransferase [Ferruginibacter sp.]
MNKEVIYYNSPIGILELNAIDDKLTALLFTNSYKGKKVDEASIQFEKATSNILKKTITQLDEYFKGDRKIFDINYTLNGTPFQQTVWNELMNITYGNTISYLRLSKRIGNVKAIRAVGTANGNNQISIIIPCHRVIGSNGDLIGYGGDLWRKKWLLEHEAKFGNGVQSLF